MHFRKHLAVSNTDKASAIIFQTYNEQGSRYCTGYLCEACYKRGLLHNAYNLWVFIRWDLINRGEMGSLDG